MSNHSTDRRTARAVKRAALTGSRITRRDRAAAKRSTK